MDFAMLVAITGISIVFLALIFLIIVFVMFGKIMKRLGPKPSAASIALAPQSALSASVGSEAAEEDELLAVIAAAVAVTLDDAKLYAIRSVKRVQAGRPVWAAAGLAENTRPF